MAAASAVCCEKVQVQARHVERGHERGGKKAGEAPLGVVKVERMLFVCRLLERAVVVLFGDGARQDVAEAARYANSIEKVGGGEQVFEALLEGLVLHRFVEGRRKGRFEKGDDRERGVQLLTHLMRLTVGGDLVDLAAEHHHLPVKVVEGPQPKVAVAFDLGKGNVLFVQPLH